MIFKNSILLTGLLMSITSASIGAEPAHGLNSDLVNPGYHQKPDWFKESFLDLEEDIKEAKAANRRVLLYFYQDGCPYCEKLLQDNLGQKRIADKTRKYFDVIAINMWGDKEVTTLSGKNTTEKQFSEEMKVMYTPTLVFLTEKGQIALRVNGYYAPDKFESALDYNRLRLEQKISFRDYYHKNPALKGSEELNQQSFILKSPYNLKTLLQDKKPLMILFEQKKCSDCDEMHRDGFTRKDTLEQIRRFNVVRLDMWSNDTLVNFDGKTISAKRLAQNLNVLHSPSIIFFDKKDKDVFRVEAYLKSFHIQSVMDYVASGAYKSQPNFQRFISQRAADIESSGVHVDLMK